MLTLFRLHALGHPDVRTLYLVLDDASAGSIEFRSPPLLRSSWQVIVGHGSKTANPSQKARRANLTPFG